MRLKLDENVDASLASIFADARHDVETVYSEGLKSSPDENLFVICDRERRALITNDLDFASVLRFRPTDSFGIIVLRSRDQLFTTTRMLAETAIRALAEGDVHGKLWIVEPGRMRVHES